MTETSAFELTIRDCSRCGGRAVTSPVCVRPDLCFSCFTSYLAGVSLVAGPAGDEPGVTT